MTPAVFISTARTVLTVRFDRLAVPTALPPIQQLSSVHFSRIMTY